MTLFRTCIVTKEKKHRDKLLKITRINNYWYFDEDKKLDGRSFYLNNDKDNLKRLKKMFKRFKMTKENMEEIIEHIEGYNE